MYLPLLWILLMKIGNQNTQGEILSFPLPPIVTTIWFDYISITFGYLKFISGLLH
jgi:hypothetical protein